MKAIILAAGSSTRLGSLTKTIPKGLLEINGVSIIQKQIEIYRKNGIDEIIIIVGPNSEKFVFKNVKYVQDLNYEEHEVLGSLMTAKEFMDEGFIMTYSDIIYEESILKSMLNSENSLTVAVDLKWEKNYQDRSEHPKTQADNVLIQSGKVLKIKKNIIKEKDMQTLGEFIGMMKISKEGVKEFIDIFLELNQTCEGQFQNAPTFKKAYLTDLLQELIDRRKDVFAQIIKGKWMEVDTLQDLEKANNDFKE